MTQFRIALCQLECVAGDFDGVVDRILTALEHVRRADCDLAVFPGRILGGSPLGDLVDDPGFMVAHDRALTAVAAATGDQVVVLGGLHGHRDPVDAVFVCADGMVQAIHPRSRDGVTPTGGGAAQRIAGVPVGVVTDVAEPFPAEAGLVVIADAEPFRPGRYARRRALLVDRAVAQGVGVVRVNRAGAQDGLVFDGGSAVFDAEGVVVAEAARFETRIVVADVPVAADTTAEGGRGAAPGPERRRAAIPGPEPVATLSGEAEMWQALVTGLATYVRANGFTDVALGLSGGVDSALVAAIAADAVGPERVHGIAMPSRYSSDHSLADAERLAQNLGIDLSRVPIEPAHHAFLGMLDGMATDLDGSVTDQNVQARIRGVLLMAMSNEFGWLVLACGNKSEAAVGYSTLYGDAVGALSVIGDVFKSEVYALCRWRNGIGSSPVIPESILTKAPSAELRPDQRDDQTLPSYEILDPMLRDHVERGLGVDALIDAGYPGDDVERVVSMVRRAEYKRRQAPPPVVVSDRAFGEDRRFPVTSGFDVRPRR